MGFPFIIIMLAGQLTLNAAYDCNNMSSRYINMAFDYKTLQYYVIIITAYSIWDFVVTFLGYMYLIPMSKINEKAKKKKIK